ncbi:MAG: ParB/RepB/Spo0J family partition protein [Candidatus Cloacimonetes bacterium]|jgi:ParB family chromosome partitioning protein|nr:ParB/RepB/Spo0J family partition protein [Candidatus Cloacimonadota bacterium]MDY0337906.1 ParB/RepB/Spo0J family partition protein [Candidatus Cloacimonadaceae bacterium]MDD2544421.1 ParB/RepB/Spo0J family partition protein [Candidatus Cloacimonadota bacterium]MDD2684393.1 ParB/RepB/Spo0J family partition protein [Candidatus Cloacimonadota bacterium]MDD3098155.1 ParB/RepB/Spo0J family partition protein [Candidatus Cloacimonadota bacterium]
MNEHLGRGLSALIPNAETKNLQNAGIGTLPIDRIRPNRFQPRKRFDTESLKELAQSIVENGIIQPLIVTKSTGSEYELIAGERRLEAAKMAGLEEVPVVIRSVSKKEQLQMAIIENIQREDLDPVEEAMAYQTLADDYQLTHQQIAQVMGKDRVTITNSMRLLKLPDEVLQMLADGQISAGHARSVLSVEADYQVLFAQHIVKYKLSTRQAEEKAKSFVESLQHGAEPKTALTRSLETELSHIFRLKVSVKEHKGKGKITLEYRNQRELEELKSLLEKLK